MFDKILHTIAKGVITVGVAVSSLFGAPTHNADVAPAQQQAVGASIPVVVAVFQTSLQSGITATATSMTLVSGTDKAGNNLSGYECFNIDEGTSIEEFVCGTASGTAVTSMLRGLDPVNGSLEVTALKKVHKRGASVKITNYPSLGIVSRVLNGTDTIPNPITYASGVTPTGSSDLTDKEYVLSVVSGGAVSFEKVVVTGTAGETVAAGNLVYLKSSDSRWWKTSASTASTVENVILGIAQGSGTAGNTIGGGVLIKGTDTNQSGLTLNSVYYASNTSGAIATSAGTKTVGVGQALSTSSIMFVPRFNQQLTQDQINAMGGSIGVPSSTNKFVTQNNLSTGLTDQIQSTQNGTVEVGEANSTTKKNLLAQSFTPTITKIRGVDLYKSADTGTFTGTVTVSLQADSSGSPSGSDLATKTYTNAQWLANPVGQFEAVFSAEYTSMTAGSLYWIVVTTSTSDTSNHPNLGTNTAGGYSSGSTKYKNTTDGWVAISTIDLYFKTLEGTYNQAVVTNTSGKIENTFLNTKPVFQQMLTLGNINPTTSYALRGLTTTTDGSTMWTFGQDNNAQMMTRYEKDSVTGQYFFTHTYTNGLYSTNAILGMANVGLYLYVCYDAGAAATCYRYLAADLTGETLMTVPTLTSNVGLSVQLWSDGTFLYFMASGITTVTKLSISGTTLSTVTTSPATATVYADTLGNVFYDGTNYYSIHVSGNTATMYKMSDVYGTSASATSRTINLTNIGFTNTYVFGLPTSATDSLYLAKVFYTSPTGTNTPVYGELQLNPVTKP